MKMGTAKSHMMGDVQTVAHEVADHVTEREKAVLEQSKTVLQVAGLNIVTTRKTPRKKIKKENLTDILISGVDLSIRAGEMLALVGESGSGKSVTASAILGLLPGALQVSSGQIKLNGVDIQSLSEKERRRMRGKDMAYIFQHYESSFTPFLKIGKQLVEVIRIHERIPVQKARHRALDWLQRVRLPAERVLNSYPFQLSGGQLQRASLAAALMMKPSLIIADEPTTALDALTGEQVLDLLVQLQKETGCAVLLISHDLTHVLKRADRIAVMYGGKVVETGPVERVRSDPRHPYTQLLLQARPILSKHMPQQLPTIPGEPGAVARQGCPFALRCPERTEACNRTPPVRKVGGIRGISGLVGDVADENSHTGKTIHPGESSHSGDTDATEAHLAACHLMDTEEAQQDATASGSQTNQKVVYL